MVTTKKGAEGKPKVSFNAYAGFGSNVKQELTDPKRNIATSVLVEGGESPLASVRLTAPIPKARIFDAMDEIRKCRLAAPVKAGTVVIKGILGLDADVIVTKNVEKA